MIAGSPETVRDKLSWVLKDLKVGQLMALQQIGSMPKHLVLKNTELFAKEVMPSIKKIWAEEWGRFVVTLPLPGQQRAVGRPGRGALERRVMSMSQLKTISLRGGDFDVKYYREGTGEHLVFLHSAGGLPAFTPELEALSKTVHGYGATAARFRF